MIVKVEVTTQKQLDQATKNGHIAIVRSGYFEAYGSSQVTAYGSSQVTAYDSSQVRASGSSQVRASGSSQVRAYGSSQVRAYGSSQVTATRAVAVTVHGDLVIVTGGVRIDAPTLDTVEAWLENYGIEPVDGIVTLFKAVRSDYRSSHDFAYAPGTVPVAPDWDGGGRECGGGLHFSPFPWMAQEFDYTATVFVGCPVAVSDIRTPDPGDSYPQKVKARGCAGPVFLVDIDGNAVSSEGGGV
ncbi:MAG: hypothetical protein ABIJ75_03540 [Actinomycetota bacterium]